MNKLLRLVTTLLFLFGLSGYAHAITVDFDFTGECDDCAFNGVPGSEGFDPLNDGLTETVTGTLSIDGLSVDGNGMIDSGEGTVTFTYNGSSLINPFTMGSPYLFTPGLLPSGEVADGFEFQYASTENLADPNNPVFFDFPNFCTPLGEQVLEFGCGGVGDITFTLDSVGNWSIEGASPADVGSDGQLVESAVPIPAAVYLFGSGFLGLLGIARRKAA